MLPFLFQATLRWCLGRYVTAHTEAVKAHTASITAQTEDVAAQIHAVSALTEVATAHIEALKVSMHPFAHATTTYKKGRTFFTSFPL